MGRKINSLNYNCGDDLLSKVISGGYCIGCGACAVNNDNYKINENDDRAYRARAGNSYDENLWDVCPFISTENENSIALRLYGACSNYDKSIGYYKGVYAGHVVEGNFREKGSSGGIITWVLDSLMRTGKIDGVIHVSNSSSEKSLFEYKLSETIKEVRLGAKSRYYPVHFDEVLRGIRESNKKYAFVGVPCFVKAIRLLMLKNEQLYSNIKYCFAIFCGHFKTKAFSEMIGWQLGIKPTELTDIDFRVKISGKPASQYGVRASKAKLVAKGKVLSPVIPTRNLYGMDWGLGYFKQKACDWCDDIAGETADLACGDAWLPEFEKDSRGTNIIIIRNKDIHELLKSGVSEGRLNLKEQSVKKVYQSQAGNYRHRREGLAVRIDAADTAGVWHPEKRISADDFDVSDDRRKIYLLRSRLSEKSHVVFKEAKKLGFFYHFPMKMILLEARYYLLNKRLFRASVKIAYQLLMYLKREAI